MRRCCVELCVGVVFLSVCPGLASLGHESAAQEHDERESTRRALGVGFSQRYASTASYALTPAYVDLGWMWRLGEFGVWFKGAAKLSHVPLLRALWPPFGASQVSGRLGVLDKATLLHTMGAGTLTTLPPHSARTVVVYCAPKAHAN